MRIFILFGQGLFCLGSKIILFLDATMSKFVKKLGFVATLTKFQSDCCPNVVWCFFKSIFTATDATSCNQILRLKGPSSPLSKQVVVLQKQILFISFPKTKAYTSIYMNYGAALINIGIVYSLCPKMYLFKYKFITNNRISYAQCNIFKNR